MGKWREEVKELPCGCKVGRSKSGPWFYDYLCEVHVGEVYDENERYSPKLAERLTEKLNEQMKLNEKYRKLGEFMKELSDTQAKAYLFIKEAKQPLPIRDMPHNLQGTIGHLKKLKIVETYRAGVIVKRHGFTSMKKTNCVRTVKK